MTYIDVRYEKELINEREKLGRKVHLAVKYAPELSKVKFESKEII